MSWLLRISTALVLCAALGPVPAGAGQLVEFYHKDLDHYFQTSFAPELKALDEGTLKGWVRTGFTIETYEPASAPPGSFAVCRFMGNPARGLNSHLYTASPAECATVKQKWPNEWLLETEDAFRAHAVNPNTGNCPASTRPVYRLYNNLADANHRYTTDSAVVDAMLAKGYVLEGYGNPQRPVIFCASNLPPAAPIAGAPVCTLEASTAFPIVNTPVTLTATCSGSPTSYGWINCAGTGNTCTVNASTVGSVNYGVVATNAKGTSAPASLALAWGLAAAATPVCSVAASSTTPTLGSGLTLTASCSPSPTKYQWMGCSALLVDVCNPIPQCTNSTTSCSPVATVAGTVFYALVASNNAGTGAKAGIAVDWKPSGGAPGSTPACTITATSTTPAVNSTITLTASCTNNPTSYWWVNCNSSSQTCTTTAATPGPLLYRVTASNAAGPSAPAEVTINWQPAASGPPVCTLTPSTTTPYVGGTVTLNASCTQSPTSFTWTSCSSSTSTCVANGTALGPATYSVTATNAFGTSAPASANVTWGNPPPLGCTITRTPADGNLGVGGGAISMTAACTGGGTVTSWSWRKGIQAAWASGATANDTLPANSGAAAVTHTYGVTACAGALCAPEVITTFTVAGSGTPAGSCAGQDVVIADLIWGDRITTAANGNIVPGRTWVGRLTIPAGATSPTNQAGLVPFVEYGDAPFERLMSLSTQPCDFRGFTPGSPIFTTDLTGVNAAMAFSGSINPSISFLLQEDQQVFPPKPRLQPGQTYYINIRTIRATDGANSCLSASGTCNGLVTVMTPR